MSLRALFIVALMMVSMLPGSVCAQQPPTTNYENSGVVSEMIGSNAAGMTAYTSDFVAQFTSESAEARVNAAMERLKNQRRTSRHLASRRTPAERQYSHLGFMFAESKTKEGKLDARRIHKALGSHELESGPVRVLISSLRGLLSEQQIDATRFVEAVQAYNRVVEEGTDSFLTDAPREFLNIRLVLASLMGAVTSGSEVELSPVRGPEQEPVSAEQLRLLSPKSLEEIDAKAPLIKPGTTTATPTAFGARWGQLYGSISYQPLSRYLTFREHDWKSGKWSDGTLSLGAGIGNPHRWVGLDVTVNIFDTFGVWSFNEFGQASEFGQERTLSLKLHRALPYESAVALGYENVWHNSPVEDEGGSSIYGVVTKVFKLRGRRNTLFSRATLSVGLGNDRFLSEPEFQRRAKGVNAFGSVGVRVWSFMNVVADWTGQDLNVGVSVTPIPRVPLVLTPALVDVTGRAGDQVRFSIGAALTYDFRR